MKPIFFALFFLVSLAVTAGCVRLFGVASTLNVALTEEPSTLDPVQARDASAQLLIAQLQRGLTQINDQKQTVGDLAESWTWEPSANRLRVVLSAQRWSDGVELKATDFVFSWKRHLSPGSGSVAIPALLKIRGARDFHSGKQPDFSQVGIHALDARTLGILLEADLGDFLTQIASPLLGPQREEVFLAHPSDFANPLHLRTLGAYQPLEWNKGQSLLFVTNSYYPAPPAIAKIQFHFISDRATAAIQLQDGKIDALLDPEAKAPLSLGNRVVEPSLPGLIMFRKMQWK